MLSRLSLVGLRCGTYKVGWRTNEHMFYVVGCSSEQSVVRRITLSFSKRSERSHRLEHVACGAKNILQSKDCHPNNLSNYLVRSPKRFVGKYDDYLAILRSSFLHLLWRHNEAGIFLIGFASPHEPLSQPYSYLLSLKCWRLRWPIRGFVGRPLRDLFLVFLFPSIRPTSSSPQLPNPSQVTRYKLKNLSNLFL